MISARGLPEQLLVFCKTIIERFVCDQKFNEIKGGTEISFDIDFEIENKFLNILMSKSFEFGLNKIADAFQKRAEDLYRPIDN